MLSNTLLVSESPGLATITLNRPEKLNALSSQVLEELSEVIGELESRSFSERPRVLLITGAGDRAFAAGADVAELSELDTPGARTLSDLGHRLGTALDRASFVSLAVVNGFALGGGLELALAADLIVCSERARFGQPEVGLGLIPGFGGTFRLMARIGPGWAKRLVFTGETIDAALAERIGLVQAVYAHHELLLRAEQFARAIASKAPLSLLAAKRTFSYSQYRNLEDAAEYEAQRFSELFSTEDAGEGLAAMLGKRPAGFVGR